MSLIYQEVVLSGYEEGLKSTVCQVKANSKPRRIPLPQI